MKHAHNYIPLPHTLRKNTYTYTLYQRGTKALIYEQWFANKIIAYEVFVKRIVPERIIKGITLPAKERFPSNEDFGYTAWTYKTVEKALKKFNELE